MMTQMYVGTNYFMAIVILLYIPYSSKFSRSITFVIFVRCKLITKILSTKFFSPMGLSIGAAMNHEK